MKKSLRIIAMMVIATATIVINGCSKGKDGAPGADGPAGNANVVSHTYSASSWTNGSSAWYVTLSVPELTSSNINSAAVQVYFSTSSGIWTALPFTEVATVDYFMQYTYAASNIEIDWIYNGVGTGSSPTSYYSGTSFFKVVVIPPALIKENPGLDLKNYTAVKNALHLKD
jgi:hypothetical protein